MIKRIFILTIVLFLLIPAYAFSAGTVTQAWTQCTKNVECLAYTWTADASAATVPATASNKSIDGYVIQVVTNPGSTAPTDDYDITLTNSDGADVMGGALANRDTANSEIAIPKVDGTNYADAWVSGTLTLNISNNSVNSATGVVRVYIKRP